MNKMPWFRFYSEALNDKKIARAVRLSGQPKALVLGVWLILLCLASESPKRGCLMISDDFWLEGEEILAEMGIDMVTFGKILNTFLELNMLSLSQGYEITNWGKRQFESDSSTNRVRKCRAKKKAEKEMKQHETFPERSGNALDTDTEKEQNREITDEETATHDALADALCNVARAGRFGKQTLDTAADLALMSATPEQVLMFGEWWSKYSTNGKPWLKNVVNFWDDFINDRPPHFVKEQDQVSVNETEHLSGSW